MSGHEGRTVVQQEALELGVVLEEGRGLHVDGAYRHVLLVAHASEDREQHLLVVAVRRNGRPGACTPRVLLVSLRGGPVQEVQALWSKGSGTWAGTTADCSMPIRAWAKM